MGTGLYTFERHTKEIYSLAFSPLDGEFLATGSNDSTLCFWRIKVCGRLASLFDWTIHGLRVLTVIFFFLPRL
jgi:WD40 repeat protein